LHSDSQGVVSFWSRGVIKCEGYQGLLKVGAHRWESENGCDDENNVGG